MPAIGWENTALPAAELGNMRGYIPLDKAMTFTNARRVVVAALAVSAALSASISYGQSTRPARLPDMNGKEVGKNVNGLTWLDTDRKPINAHGGGVLFHEGVYYWYGEARAPRSEDGGWQPMPGVGVYSSTDLMHWKSEGLALTVLDNQPHDMTLGCVIERPKVIHNKKTGKFVMWMHHELKDQGYAAARAALAVSDSPTGPFTFVKSVRPNAGTWSMDMPSDQRTPLTREEFKALNIGGPRAAREGLYARRDFETGPMSRDMTLFVDPDDGKGYLISSAEENYTLAVHELTDDYLDFTGKWSRVQPAGHNEAPAIAKQDGKFYMLASGCTGWDPNPARYLTADSIYGPWTSAGNPCIGVNPSNNLGPEKTWGGQSTFILPRPDKPGEYVAMFDVWRPRPELTRSGYIWVPMKIEGGEMKIEWQPEWKAE